MVQGHCTTVLLLWSVLLLYVHSDVSVDPTNGIKTLYDISTHSSDRGDEQNCCQGRCVPPLQESVAAVSTVDLCAVDIVWGLIGK